MLNQTLNIDNPKKYPISISFPKGLGTVSIERPLSNAKSGSYIMEIWKDIPGYEGKYQASSFGRIKSLSRISDTPTRQGIRFISEKILKLDTSEEYYRTNLCKGKGKTYWVHRIIAKTFIPNFQNKRTVNHKNGIKTDNRVSNLEWATYSENIKHSFKNGFHKPTKSINAHFTKINYIIVKEIRELYEKKNYSQSKIASKYGLDQSTISYIVNYKTWKNEK